MQHPNKEVESSDLVEKPAWYEEGSEVYSVDSRTLTDLGVDAETARAVLDAASIPCYLEFCEYPPEDSGEPPTHRWRVLVPGKLNMRATNILDRDIFNDEFEATWRAHLEMLSEQELGEADPREVFCGLFDRIERVVRVYRDEHSRRAQVREHR
jgi:hypothetical protein